MTIKEAIGQLKCNVEGDYINLDDLEAFNFAISALEKQIAKKPTDICTTVLTWGLCPSCKGELNKLGGKPNKIFKGTPYCCDCGQALDWSDTE
jgi:hypothetical protein